MGYAAATTSRLSLGKLILLGSITALSSLGTHMFVPALPAAADELKVSPALVQQAVSAYLLGVGLGQLAWGPLSDLLSRTKVLLMAVGLFLLASFAAGTASGIEVLIGTRFLQGIGGAGGLIVCRALVIDASERDHAAGNLAVLTTVTLISPVLAPSIGGLITSTLGWRAIFLILAGLAAIGMTSVQFSGWSKRSRQPRPMRELLQAYRILFTDPRFLASASTYGLILASIYIFLAASPFILMREHGLSALQAGMCYGGVALGTICATLLVKAFDRRHPERIRSAALLCFSFASVALTIASLTGAHNVATIILPMAVIGFGAGLTGPVVLAQALTSHPEVAGSASSLFGAIQLGLTATLVMIVTTTVSGTPGTIFAIALAALAGAGMLLLATHLPARRAPAAF